MGEAEMEMINVPRYPQLKEYEAHFNWLQDEDEDGLVVFKFTKNSLQVMIQKLKDGIDNEESYDDQDASIWEFHPIKLLSLKLTSAFYHSLLGEHYLADQELDEVVRSIDEVFENAPLYGDHQHYYTGVRHVLEGLKGFNELSKTEVDPTTVQIEDKNPHHHHHLPDLVLVGTYAVKRHFITIARENNDNNHKHQVKLLQKMIALDPSCYMWYLYLYRQLRFVRVGAVIANGFKFHQSMPTEEEMTAIAKVIELTGDEKPNMVVKECMCLAESLSTLNPQINDNTRIDEKEETTWPKIYYHRRAQLQAMAGETLVEKVVAFIKSQIHDLVIPTIEGTAHTQGIWTDIAELYSDILPQSARDINRAMFCLTEAWKVNPKSSKINYRLAKISLKQVQGRFEDGKMDPVIGYLETAVETCPRNYGATLKLLQCYLSNPEKYKDKVWKIRDDMEKFQWNLEQQASFHFLFGCWYLLVADLGPQGLANEVDGANEWLMAIKKWSDEGLNFENIYYMGRYYSWRFYKSRLNAGRIWKVIWFFFEKYQLPYPAPQDEHLVMLKDKARDFQQYCRTLPPRRF